MSVLVKNKQRLTPRQYAQRTDRFKFHRVIKVLREMEEKEMNLTEMRREEEEKEVAKGKKEKECCVERERRKNAGIEEKPTGFEVIMDLLIESWEWSLGLSIAFGIMVFIGLRLGMLIGSTAVEGLNAAN